VTPDQVLAAAARLLEAAAAAGSVRVGPGLALTVHTALQQAAGGWPATYIAARDQLTVSLHCPVGAWALDPAVGLTDAAAVCRAATQPALQLATTG
jgi:hypothetical protein